MILLVMVAMIVDDIADDGDGDADDCSAWDLVYDFNSDDGDDKHESGVR